MKANIQIENGDNKWHEVRKHSEMIKNYSLDALKQADITKDKYYEIYNTAVSLLRSIDCLDPDKRMRDSNTSIISNIANPNFPNVSSNEYYNSANMGGNHIFANNFPANPINYPTVQYPIPQPQTPLSPNDPPYFMGNGSFNAQGNLENMRVMGGGKDKQKPFNDGSGDSEGPDKQPHKRRRRRTQYAPKRNLKCHQCEAIETPEWRRGPDGDHTLCNACGLHYAKQQKRTKTKDKKNYRRVLMKKISEM